MVSENNKIYIEWIGTGSGFNATLGNTSFLIKSNEKTVLVDCGFTVPGELMKTNQLRNITDIIITHLHSDHIGGLENLGFMNYFAFKKRDEERTNIHLATERLAYDLWNHSLKGGMNTVMNDENINEIASLETYFKSNIGTKIKLHGIPEINLFPTVHKTDLENYGLQIGKEVFYSGDTIELPNTNANIIFQDCQFYETKNDVHISYNKLNKMLDRNIKSKIYLVHLGGGWDKIDPQADGFAGFVKPGQIFELENK